LHLNPGIVEQVLPASALRVKDGQKKSKTKVGKLYVTVSVNPLVVRVENPQGGLVQEIEFETNGVISFLSSDAPVFGLGEGADQFDRRGFDYPLRNGQSDRTAELGARVYSPFLVSTKGWSVFIGSPIGKIDLSRERGVFTPQRGASGGSDVIVIDAREPADALQEFIRLTGAPAMPPKWALGYMQSHRTLSNEVDVLMEAQLFRERKLPCDTFIYLGTGFCPAGWNFGHDSFQFNTAVFTRKAEDVIKDLHDKNFHVALHIVPLQRGPEFPYPSLHGNIPPAPGETLDVQHIANYWARHKELVNAGIDAWWPDEGDWFDVPSRLARHRMYYQGPLSDKPNVRPWDLQRNAYPGVSRYGGWYWSGDILSTWKTLTAHVKVGQNASLSVSPYWGTDIGGFYPAPTKEYTGELYVRWFQFATFCPSFRSHGRTWRLHSPWGWNLGVTGPVESRPPPDESELHNTSVEPICQTYLNLRYQLMPYTYTLAREAYDTGMPFIRSLWLHYPDDAVAAYRGDEYLWGRDILVAPVTAPGATNREVYLPKGTWYDWWTGAKSIGSRLVTRRVDLKTMPIYVRAGAIIPYDPIRQYMDEPVTDPTTIRIYPGADGHYVLYDDDGKSQEYLKGAGAWTEFVWHDAQKRLEIKTDSRTRNKPAAREFDVLLMSGDTHKKVTFSGAPAEVKF
jgi:alpha-glucosidase/alpha-D-xyloside xylohydrolase